MARRNKHAGHANHERWLVSYADFITLLFAFFVVLYASSQVDQRKVGRLAQAIEIAFQELGAFSPSGKRVPIENTEVVSPTPQSAKIKPTPELIEKIVQDNKFTALTPSKEDIERLRGELERSLSLEIARKEVSIHLSDEGLVLSLREIGFFDSASSQIRPAAQPTFDRIVKVLSERPYRLRVEGHTDNIPIHNERFASNWELSTARATEVVRLLIMQHRFQPGNLAAAGYAEFHPVGNNSTEEGRQMNRRVDIVVLTTTTSRENVS